MPNLGELDNLYTVEYFFDEFFSNVEISKPVNLLAWLNDHVNQMLGQVSDLSRNDPSFPLGRFLDHRKLIDIALMIKMLEDTVEDIRDHAEDRAEERAT